MKRLLFSFLFVLTAIAGWAQEQEPTTFTVGNFKYTVTDDENLYVSIAKADEAELSGALVIPSSVTYEEVTYAVTSVGASGFYGTGITGVTFPASVTSIGNEAFGNSGLTSITIPASVMTIGDAAFQGCGSLASITIEDCETPLTIPGTWYQRPFLGSPATTIYIGRDLTLTETEGDKNHPLLYDATSVEFGSKVTTINPSLFYSNTKLESVTIGSGVTTIGESAFLACGQAEEVIETVVTMGSNVTSIGANAFKDCTHIKSITLPSKLATIGNEAFGNSGLTSISIPASVTSIGEAVFQGCGSMTGITIADSEIPLILPGTYYQRPFWNPASTIYIGRDLTLTETEEDKNNPLLYEATSVEFGPKVTTINPALFYTNTKLGSLTIGSGVTTIGESAFNGCGTYWNEETNQGVEELVVTMGNNVTSIGANAFQNCSKLKSITLSSKLTTIGSEAFRNTGLTSISIPASVTNIGDVAFIECASMTSITIEDSETPLTLPGTYYQRPFWNPASTIYIGRDLTLTETEEDKNNPLLYEATSVEFGPKVTTINPALFYTNTKLGSLTIGSGVTTIGNSAFQECSALTSITIGSGVTTIGDYAFHKCSALTSVTIPASVQTIGDQVFYYVDELKNFTIEDSNTSLTIGDLGYGISGENFYLGRDVTYTSTLNGQLVFSNTQHVTVGPKVKTLNNNMFYSRNRIKSVDLTHATSLTTIGDNVFYHCDSLENITIPATVTSIGYEAFLYTDRLNNVIFEDGDATLTMDSSIGSGLCGQSMYLGRNISGPTTRFVWTDCKTLTVGPKVTTLYANMFKESALETIDLTNATSLTTLDADVFGNCSNLAEVKVGWITPLAIDDNAFNGSITHGEEAYATLNVPAGTKEAYAAADGWKNFEHVAHWSTLVTLTATAHGSIVTAEATASNGTKKYLQPKEDAVVYTLTADEGYELTALTDNDAAVSPLPTLGEEQTRANTEGEEFVTLNASFTPITYNLTYTLNGGTATNPATYTIETTTFTLNNPTKAGYDFAGWKLNGVGDAMMTVTITQGSTGHLAYTATWTPTVYNIVYTMDGGTATPANPTTYTIETETFTLNNPTKTGHTFKGWKLNGEGDAMMEVTIAQGSTGHLAYTATWQINKYTITFDSNGGSAVDPITQDYGTTVTAPDDPTKPGCDFAGWTPELPETMPAENMTVTATWTELTYTVSITGGGVSADNMNPKYGDDVVITIAEDEDRTLNTLTVNGEDVTAYVVDGQYTIHNVTGNVVVVATFNATKEFITLAQGVGTFSCAQDLNFTGSGLKAYIAAGYNKSSKVVLLVRVYDIPAGTGLYLKGEADVTYKIPYSTSQAYYVNMLKANLTASSIAKTSGDMSNFLLNKVDGEYGFFAPSETATLGAQKAYLQVPTSFMSGSEDARAISIAFEDDETTNISDFELFTNSNEHLYNLKGQRVEKAGRGLYIKNGKKVVIK